MPEATKYLNDLTQAGNALAAAEAAKEKAEAEGTAGMTKALSKPLTRPRSPKLSRTRAPILPEPQEIKNSFDLKEVPSYLNRTTLATLDAEKIERQAKVRDATTRKYSEKDIPKFNETKYGRSKLEIARELEEARTRDLKFDASYYHDPPNFDEKKAKVRLNVASILREDYLFRKQQAKDVAILEEYEDQLRDPTEYFLWQKKMEHFDDMAKLRQVVERREQAKQSSEEAALAFKMMQDGNKEIASMVRKQGDAITKRKQVERDILLLGRRETVASISEVRDVNPSIAVAKVREQRVESGAKAREALKTAWEAKIEEDEAEELVKADRIRQLRAVNSIHKKFIKVFDPTVVAGPAFNDQMSYMEMKERVDQAREKDRVKMVNKQEDIAESKQKRAKDLEERALSIEKLRRIKRESNKNSRDAKMKMMREQEEKAKRIREESAIVLRDELRHSRQKAADERKALLDEQDRVRRQQQYLGASKGAVEENSNKEMQMAAERKVRAAQKEVADRLARDAEVRSKNRSDKIKVEKEALRERKIKETAVNAEVLADKRRSVEKLKESILMKKAMVQTGREQFSRTKTVRIENNRYAQRINDEIHDATQHGR